MWNPDVCRLCLSNKQLVSVFENQENEDNNLKQIVFLTTGVEILENDVVSQKICGHCRKVTLKMLEFKEKSLENDTYHKEQYAEYLKQIGSKSLQNEDVIVENGHSSIQSDDKIEIESDENTNKQTKREQKIHSSISSICRSYPEIKLPNKVLSLDVNPQVCMELDTVEKYFIDTKLNMNKAVEEALKSTKKTLINKKQNVADDKKDKTIILLTKDNLKRKLDEDDGEKPGTSKSKRTNSFSSEEKLHDITNTCKVCGSIQSSVKNLKNHVREHFRCNFCGHKFRLLIRKEEHEEKCFVKDVFTNTLTVVLNRIDAEAYKKNPINEASNETIDLTDNDDETGEKIIETNENEKISDNPPLILPPNLNENEKNPDIPPLIPPSILNENKKITDIPPSIPISNPTENYAQTSSSALIRPKLRIYNDDVLKSIDFTTNDTAILRQLIKIKSIQYAKVSMETQTHINPPHNEQITKDVRNNATTFKKLKSHLYAFKLPVNIEHGNFNVSYVKHEKSPSPKKFDLWTNVKPVGLTNTPETPLKVIDNKVILSDPDRVGTQQIVNQNSINAKPVQVVLNHSIRQSFNINYRQTNMTLSASNKPRSSNNQRADIAPQPTYASQTIPNISQSTASSSYPTNTRIPNTLILNNINTQQQVLSPNSLLRKNVTVSTALRENYCSNSVITPMTTNTNPTGNNNHQYISTIPSTSASQQQVYVPNALIVIRPTASTNNLSGSFDKQRKYLSNSVPVNNKNSATSLSYSTVSNAGSAPNAQSLMMVQNCADRQSNDFSIVGNRNTNCSVGTINSSTDLQYSVKQNVPTLNNNATGNFIRPLIRVRNICELK